MHDMGRAAFDEAKSEDKRTITLELLIQALEGKKFGFLRGTFGGISTIKIDMSDYDKVLKEVQDQEEADKDKRKKAKEEKSKEKDEEEDAKKKKKKAGKSKGKC
jgi:hypothetical protein